MHNKIKFVVFFPVDLYHVNLLGQSKNLEGKKGDFFLPKSPSHVSSSGLHTCLCHTIAGFTPAWNPLHTISDFLSLVFCLRRWLTILLLNKICTNSLYIFRIEIQIMQYCSSQQEIPIPSAPPCFHRMQQNQDFRCIHCPALPQQLPDHSK